MLYVLKTYTHGIIRADYAQYQYFTEGEENAAMQIAEIRKNKGDKPVLLKYGPDGAVLVWSHKAKKAA